MTRTMRKKKKRRRMTTKFERSKIAVAFNFRGSCVDEVEYE